MAIVEDEKIINLLCSLKEKEREYGAILLIKKYETKARNWIKKQSFKIDADDAWQESVSLMIFAIQSKKYEKYPEVELYTYFHKIIKSCCIKLSKNADLTISLSEQNDRTEQQHDSFKPDVFTELNQHKNFINECLSKYDEKTQRLLMEIIVEDARLIDIFQDFGLKNYNNAKQKYFKSKNALINCLKKHIGYGK